MFVDFRRAFDSVNRKCLWYKMTKSGIRGNMFNVITSIYATVKSKVLNPDGTISEAFDCIIGVRQGKVYLHFYLLYTSMIWKNISDKLMVLVLLLVP